MISIAPSGAREAAAEPQPPLHHQRDACLAFLRRLGDEGGQQLFDLCAVTVWTLHVFGLMLADAHHRCKGPVTRSAIIFIGWHSAPFPMSMIRSHFISTASAA